MSVSKVFVLVDMDGVLADFDAGLLEKLQKFYPTLPIIPLNELNTFYIEDQYKARFGKDVGDKVVEIVESKNFFLDLPPVEGAVKGLKSLAERSDVQLFICSSPLRRFEDCVLEKYQWVVKQFGPEFTEKIILTRDKTIINAHFLVDDKPDICGTQKKQWTQFLFETHHNRHVAPSSDQIKVFGWKDPTLHDKITKKFNEINSHNNY